MLFGFVKLGRLTELDDGQMLEFHEMRRFRKMLLLNAWTQPGRNKETIIGRYKYCSVKTYQK